MIEASPELLARHDRPGPRYTSYPTAVEFAESFGPEQYAERLDRAARRVDDPLSLYVHLPFCAARCSFCACHVVVAKRPEVSERYLGTLLAEAAMVAKRLGQRRRVVQYHWGGGTPTYYSSDQLSRLHELLLEHFELDLRAEVAIEVDPRITTQTQLETLRGLGFNRLSMGVQDLDPGVQQLIGRNQTRQQTETLFHTARRLGFDSVNLDLIYGLPGQDLETLRSTLDAVLELRPDRLAVYSFAFVPWMRPHQKRIDENSLPDTEAKFGLLSEVVTSLTAAGYRHIGMDHFALASDELVAAANEGTLTRTFMGYTTKRDTETVALGSSGISDIDGAYAQNHRRLASYYQAIEADTLPIERGYRLNTDDQIRRVVITELMCNGAVDLNAVGERYGLKPDEYFAAELASLQELCDQGMAEVDGTRIRATPLGQLFVRRLAAEFDAHSLQRPDSSPAFSRTV